MRPKPRLFAPNARSVRLASSTPWPTASVRAYGVGPRNGNVGASYGSDGSQPEFDDAWLVDAPSVHGTGFQGSGCVLV